MGESAIHGFPFRVRFLVVLVACAAACGVGHADRSRLGGDSGGAEPGDCELEAAVEQRSSRGAARERNSAIQLDCGVGWASELTLFLARRRGDGDRTQDWGVEGRTLLYWGGDRGLALLYGSSTERDGRGPWRRSGQFMALEASWQPANEWRLETRLGSDRDRLARWNSTTWALAAERAITERLEARVELSGDDRSRPLTQMALRWEVLPETAAITLTGGGRAGASREHRLEAALTLEF